MSSFRRIWFRIALTITLALLFAVVPSGTRAQGTLSGSNSSFITAVPATGSNTMFAVATTQAASCATRDASGNVASGNVVFTVCDLREVNTQLETRKDDGKGPTLYQVKQVRHILAGDQLAPLHYAALARSVGLETPAEEATVLQAIADAKLNIYPFAKVDDYLYRQALRMGTRYRWVWKPVGKKALDGVTQSGMSYQTTPGLGLVMGKVYTREVPVRVLTEMKTLAGCLPDALFLVSDFEVVKPDPFLALTTPALLAEGKIWIIDQWDEPGFVEKGQPVNLPEPPPVPASLVAAR